jgi:preprotein translocase subunit SecA
VQKSHNRDRRLRNRIGWRQHLARLQGSPVIFDLGAYYETLLEIGRFEPDIERLSDGALAARVHEIRRVAGPPKGGHYRAGPPKGGHYRARGGHHGANGGLALVRSEFYALVREASRRALGTRPFDEQVLAALALDRGHVVEMQTGEGKTLAAVMPASLNALSGRGVHVLTFNDYLAGRDAEWMGPVYAMLGLSVAFVQPDMTAAARRRAYLADVTYVTAKEAGFDHLRDLLATDPRQLVHRPFHFALVDEADSLLIDEARVPLVVAGSVDRETSRAPRLAALVAALEPGVHFDADEYGRDVELTEAGVEEVERALAVGSLHAAENYRLLTEVNCALHAHQLLRRDVDYIVRDGRIAIVDEFTGRVVADRHWPDGLQAALEAKEGLERRPDGQILGSITLQHFLRRYPRLCGMTGTAQPAAEELKEFYGLEVVVVPTHRPVRRVDQPDVVFTHRDVKARAVVDEIQRAHASGRPVLVGTLTVAESERLAEDLRGAGVPCQVLNAKNDAIEASVVARAGTRGAVTIATNMAGRGTDIRLGGEDEADRAQIAALGGLYVIGTSRHESRRVDLQLRGRAGRQGDPGESRFFISLEDELLVRYGIEALIAGQVVTGRREQPVDHPVLRSEIARAHRIVEGQNIEIRRTLWRYASVVERQRSEVMAVRQAILHGSDVPDAWRQSPRWNTFVEQVGDAAARVSARAVMLFQIDRAWREHLALAADLREGIHLVGLGGQDPLTRFTTELTVAFRGMESKIDEAALETLERMCAGGGIADLERLGIRGPSSTWTYLVNDDPFRDQIGMLLTGPGHTSVAIYAAAVMMPLLLVWGLLDRLLRRRPKRRGIP